MDMVYTFSNTNTHTDPKPKKPKVAAIKTKSNMTNPLKQARHCANPILEGGA